MAASLPRAAYAAPATNGYSFRGVRAPQVKTSALVGELEQKLRQLRQQWTERSTRVTLSAAIEQSLLHNPELAQAYSQIQQGQWNLIAVRRQWYPTLSALSSGPAGSLWGYRGASRSDTTTTSAGTVNSNIRTNQNGIVPILSLGWTFFDPSRGPQINAASESLRSQELLFNVSARNLVLQTQLAYFNLQEQEQLISSYEEIFAATTTQVRQAEALFNVGNASLADVEQIRTQQYQTLSLLIATYLAVIDASASLARAIALPPGQLALPQDQLNLYGEWNLTLDDTIQQAQGLREEIQSSLAQATSASWRASALLNRYWPRFSLLANGSYAYNDTNIRNRQSGFSQSEVRSSSWDGAVGLGFNWTLFDGGIAAAEAQASRALQRQFGDQAAVQRLQISQEVEQSYATYQTSQLALLSSREQAESARKAAVAVRERFNVGYADTTSVVQTLNQAITAANAYARSQREYNSAVASLYRASAQWPGNTLTLLDQSVNQLMQR
jgi:outer membrane protein TolC